MPKPSTPAVWASGKAFGFQPSDAQQAQGFDYIATVRPSTGAPITDDHDWPLKNITTALKWIMDQIPDSGMKTAAFRDVGNGAGQIPDMSSFQSSLGSVSAWWVKFPSGLIIQGGLSPTTNPPSVQDVDITFPIAFPNGMLWIGEHDYGHNLGASALWGFKLSSLPKTVITASSIGYISRGVSTIQPPIAVNCSYIAVGF